MTRPTNPYRSYRKNEGSTIILTTSHLNTSKALTAPTTLTYRIDDLTNNRQVLDWTAVSTPSTTNDITITAAQNSLYNRSRDKEFRQVTTKATDASGNVTQDVFHYELSRIFTSDDQAS